MSWKISEIFLAFTEMASSCFFGLAAESDLASGRNAPSASIVRSSTTSSVVTIRTFGFSPESLLPHPAATGVDYPRQSSAYLVRSTAEMFTAVSGADRQEDVARSVSAEWSEPVMANRKLRPAAVFLSGGLDSATVLAIANADRFAPYAMTFLYGQWHAVEARAARRVAERAGVAAHREVTIDLRAFGGSALTGALEVPKGRTPAQMAAGIPVTYVPARDTIFLAYALAWVEVVGTADILVRVNAQDHAGYPDCRPESVAAFEAIANLATKAGVEGRRFRVHAPLIDLPKAEIVRRGLAPGVDYALTTSKVSTTTTLSPWSSGGGYETPQIESGVGTLLQHPPFGCHSPLTWLALMRKLRLIVRQVIRSFAVRRRLNNCNRRLKTDGCGASCHVCQSETPAGSVRAPTPPSASRAGAGASRGVDPSAQYRTR